MFLEQVINGITLGGIYALIALGYTMVYGILFLINFAHSEIFMSGGYFGLFALLFLQKIPFFQNNVVCLIACVFLFSMVASGLLGVIMERLAYRPLRNAPRLAPLISAIGVSIFLQNLFMLIISSQSLPFEQVFPTNEFFMGSLHISYLQIFIIFIPIFLMFILNIFIKKTKIGKAIRATSQDIEVAQLMGININLIISLVFFIGGSLGGAGGTLFGMYYGNIKYNMGFIPGIKAFTAAVLGGIGNIQGAMFGGYILGILECLGAGYISSMYKDVFAFVILIFVLIFRPTGILGEDVVEKT